MRKLLSGTLTCLPGRTREPPLTPNPASSNRKQLPSGAPNRRGEVETRRTRWLSRVNPMAGSWSLAAYPRSHRPVSPHEKLQAFSPHSVGRSTRRNRRLGDFPQMMIKPQEESSRVSLSAMSDD